MLKYRYSVPWFAVFTCLSLFAFSSQAESAALAPTATTNAATSVTTTTAILNGQINDNGATTTVTFDFGTTTSYGSTIAATPGTISAGTGSKAVTAAITNLTCNTIYHYRVNAVNSVGTTYGVDKSFTAVNCSAIYGKLWHVTEAQAQNAIPSNVPNTTPNVAFYVNSPINFNTTGSTVSAWLNSSAAFNIVENTAGTLSSLMDNGSAGTLVEFTGFVTVTNGQQFTVTHDDGLTLIIGGLNLGFSPGPTAPTVSTATYTGPSGTLPFQLVYDECCGGPAVLQISLPLASAVAPTSTTKPATGVTATAATLNAQVNDNGAVTTVTFDFGTSTSYGSAIAATPGTLSSGTGSTAITAASSGLTCNTVYHYRVKAVNSVGTTYGADTSFTTVACPVVTPSAGTGGSISPNTAQTINYGATTSFTVTPNTGYTASVAGTCGGTLSGNTYTTNAITANCTVVAAFTPIAYTVTPSVSGTGGSISPTTAQTINYGATTSFTVTPNTGYTASVAGTCGGTLSGNTYTTNAITANCTVVAAFTPIAYTVTPSVSGTGGSISPTTAQTINYGATTSFTVTPNTGYTASVAGTCGGTLSGNTYTTNAITANCTVVAAFTPIAYTVTPSVSGTGGSISPTTAQTVNYGATTSFTVTPNTGYTASVAGTCGGTLSGNTYTTNAITANCTVVAAFTPIAYTVTPSVSGTGGSISPTTAQTVNYGATTSFTVTPNTGYTASVAGTCGGTLSGNTYTTNAITANCTVVAAFTPIAYTVTPSVSGTGGSISPTTAQTVNYGATTSFTVTPNTGYTASVAGTCGGTLSGNTYTTNAITANCTVVAAFTPIAYTVTPTARSGGSVVPNTPQTVNYGATISFKVTPDVGYVASIGGTCGGTLSGTTYTTGPITANCIAVIIFTYSGTTASVTITPTVSIGGTVSPSTPQAVDTGGTISFTVTAKTGYINNPAKVGGTCPSGYWSGDTYYMVADAGDCTVRFNFLCTGCLPNTDNWSTSIFIR